MTLILLATEQTPAKPCRHQVPSLCIPVLLLLFCFSGCGGPDTGRLGMSGTVTLDGNPLSEGTIELYPLRGTGGPASGGDISNGRFAIAPAKGLFAGSFRVEIKAYRGTGKNRLNKYSGEEFEVREQYLSKRYNQRSELTCEISTDGENYQEFHLKSE